MPAASLRLENAAQAVSRADMKTPSFLNGSIASMSCSTWVRVRSEIADKDGLRRTTRQKPIPEIPKPFGRLWANSLLKWLQVKSG
jgi:hypothetical protein